MVKPIMLAQKILREHIDPNSRSPEVILLGYCDNEVASEHISRYVIAFKFANGTVLDIASGSCYGSSILRHAHYVVSVDINIDLLRYGRTVYGADCVCTCYGTTIQRRLF